MSTCLSCTGEIGNRNSNTCECDKGFYEKAASPLSKCEKCKDEYLACSDENTPTECNGTNRKPPSEKCVCQDGHFKDPNSINCILCSYPCSSCLLG